MLHRLSGCGFGFDGTRSVSEKSDHISKWSEKILETEYILKYIDKLEVRTELPSLGLAVFVVGSGPSGSEVDASKGMVVPSHIPSGQYGGVALAFNQNS